MMRRHGGRAHDPNGAHVGGILQTAHAGQIRRSVCAPVAYESQNFGFKQFLGHNLLLLITPPQKMKLLAVDERIDRLQADVFFAHAIGRIINLIFFLKILFSRANY
jgi:hypothetical protein